MSATALAQRTVKSAIASQTPLALNSWLLSMYWPNVSLRLSRANAFDRTFASKPSNLGDRPLHFFTSCAINMLRLLPLSWLRILGAAFAHIAWRANVRAARITRENIGLCYGSLTPEEQNNLARASMVETGRLGLEIFAVWQRGPIWLARHIHATHGEHLIRTEIAKNRGLLLLAPHLGNWEVLGLRLQSYGQTTSLYQPPKRAYLDKLIRLGRQSTGAQLLPTNNRGVAGLLKCLKSGEIAGLLPDQIPEHAGGQFSPFFDIPTYTMTLAHRLISRTGCRVLMGFVLRVDKGFDMHFVAPPEGIYSDKQDESLAAMNQAVEQCVAHCPAQYQWEYKRFRVVEPGQPGRYQFNLKKAAKP